MKGLLFVFLILALSVNFVLAFIPSIRFGGVRLSSTTGLCAKKKAVDESAASKYWQGDWVCADCGYIYDIDYDGGGLYFEQQKKGFICPQCSAPRRRYAKAVGDQWGVTNDGGDLPIYAFTFAGLALTVWFALVYVPTL